MPAKEDSDERNSSEESGNDGDGNEDDDDNSDLFPEFDSAPSQNTCGQKQVYPESALLLDSHRCALLLYERHRHKTFDSCSLGREWKSINASQSTPVARVEI